VFYLPVSVKRVGMGMLAGRMDAGTGASQLQLRLTLVTTRRSRTLVLPPIAIAIFLGLLPIAGVIYLAATCYFMFHDDLLSGLTQRQIEMQYGYEDRLARLRHEITNLTQHAKVNEAELTERLGALMARQDLLESRTTLVASLAERSKALGGTAHAAAVEPAAAANPVFFGAPLADAPPAAQAHNAAPAAVERAPKPKPEDYDLRLDNRSSAYSGADGAAHPQPIPERPIAPQISPLSFDYDLPLATKIERLSQRQDRLDQTQLAILGHLQEPAEHIATHLRAAFNAAGLAANQLALPASSAKPAAMGGPFVPLPISTADSAAFAHAATDAQSAIAAAERLRTLATHVPFGTPLSGQTEVTSPFGARIDPFLGRPALHTGIDLREDYGAPVIATAAGVVAFAGSDGGYGNMVEIDHGNGLSTRYAHLSGISVRQGQKVGIGTVVGHIGETGRATGPHLHYETRINGEPVDPARFLRAGARLHLAITNAPL
jgi:murein DD-endopeptidase MepM/ murein hydrolase activator NlpD